MLDKPTDAMIEAVEAWNAVHAGMRRLGMESDAIDTLAEFFATFAPDPVQSDGEELREAWLYLHKWVERGLFDKHTTPKSALEVIAHHPTAPWKNGRWDVDHKPYAEAFYVAFPKARLTSLSAPVEKD